MASRTALAPCQGRTFQDPQQPAANWGETHLGAYSVPVSTREILLVERNPLKIMVPPGRLELPRPCGQQILSLPRLPIPPQGLRKTKDLEIIATERTWST